MKLTRQYFDVKSAEFGNKTSFAKGNLTICEKELQELVKPLLKNISNISFELVKPGENARIVHVLDTIQPMKKIQGNGKEYSGFFGQPDTVGEGTTNLLRGFSVMECAPLPWDDKSASSGLLYPRDAIMDMKGPIGEFTPFSQTINLVIIFELKEGKSSNEYDNDIRLCGLKISEYLGETTLKEEPNETEDFSLATDNPALPNVVFVWQCQNQGVYSNTLLYGEEISHLVPTLLHPNEMLDGCVVSGNYVWPAFKVPTYLHVNHPIILELYKQHGKTINFKGVVFRRSHEPTNWHKQRAANFTVKLAEMLDAQGLIMAWEGGGNAAVDGMLTIEEGEKKNIKCSTVTFEFGGIDGTEGILLVHDVPQADAVISGGSIEKHYTIPQVDRVIGGDKMRLNKESGGYFPPAENEITFETTTQFYCSGNQSGHSRLFSEEY